MESGRGIKFLKAAGSPLSPMSLAKVCAALTSGCEFSGGKPLLDTVELKDGDLHREHTWSFDGSQQIEFLPNFEAERIEFNELIRRFSDLEWCAANPHHPISYLRFFVENRAGLVALLKERKPMEKIVRGAPGDRSICLIPADATPEERAEALREFNS